MLQNRFSSLSALLQKPVLTAGMFHGVHIYSITRHYDLNSAWKKIRLIKGEICVSGEGEEEAVSMPDAFFSFLGIAIDQIMDLYLAYSPNSPRHCGNSQIGTPALSLLQNCLCAELPLEHALILCPKVKC
jgi:hypothetical protein